MALIWRIAEKLKRWDDRRHSVRTVELDRDLAARAVTVEHDTTLAEIVRRAWAVGQTLDLSGIGYGPNHSKEGERFLTLPEPYYFFLAGLVRSQMCNRILEIGTHYGGSVLSMLRGVANQNEAKIVTIDITDLNPTLLSTPGITKLVGDANSEALLKRSVLAMGSKPIDLLYIDADHAFLPTIINVGLYVFLLKPRFLVLDDIIFTDGMRSLWDVIRATRGSDAIDCIEVMPEIRSETCGFGLVRLR
jgi:hypothetical protein